MTALTATPTRRRLSKRAFVLLAAISFGSPAAATTRVSDGLRLAWNDCRGTGGLSTRAFACNTNQGGESFILSCTAPVGLTSLNSAEMSVEFWFVSVDVPPWWQYGLAPACRGKSDLSTDFRNMTNAGCYAYWNTIEGGPSGGTLYQYPSNGPNHALFRYVVAIAYDLTQPTTPAGTEIYLATTKISNNKTTGTGSCIGCDIPGCISFFRGYLAQSQGDDFEYDFAFSPDGDALDTITWQCDQACVLYPDGPSPCIETVPAQRSSWGQIKAIYR
jgi:hypothetical protein